MKVIDLKRAIYSLKDDLEITISVDVSTGDADAFRRAFARELLGIDLDTMTILTTGELNEVPNVKVRGAPKARPVEGESPEQT